MSGRYATTMVLIAVFALFSTFMFFGCAVAPTKELGDAKAAIEAAKAADAGKYAAGEIKNAETALTGAMGSMEKKKYEDAKSLALSAKGHATSAKAKAEMEKASAKAKAEMAIGKADETAQKAEGEGGKVFADKEFSSAKDILSQAKAAFGSGNYEEAKDIAVLAEKQFTAAGETAKKTAQAKIAADRTIADAEEAAKEAEMAGAKVAAESEFASAHELLEEAKASYLNRNYEEAREQAVSAKEGFVLAFDAASRRAAEKQDRERTEKLRKEAEVAIADAEQAAAEADSVGASTHAPQPYQNVQDQLNSAKDAFSREQYEEAKKSALLAQSSFIDAAKAAPLLAAEAAAKEEATQIREEAVRVETSLRAETEASKAEADASRAETEQAKADAESAQAEAEQAKAAYVAAQDEAATAKAEVDAKVQAAQAEAEQAKAAYAAAQDEIARLQAQAPAAGVPTAEVEALKAEAEQAKAAYAAAQDEAVTAKAELERERAACAQERGRFEAEKVIMGAEAAEGVAAAKGARAYALNDYGRGQQLLAQAKDALAALAFPQSIETAREATRLFNMASDASGRAQRAETGALKTACERALAEERTKCARDKEQALAEEREKWALEKEQALAEEKENCAKRLAEAQVPKPAVAPVASEVDYHKVKKGECLWEIAEAIYGDPFQWPLIFRANRDKIRNPDLIHPQQQLKIPRDVTQEEIDNAIKEASERSWPKR